MSWLISRALMEDYENSRSSLGLVAEYSRASCSGGDAFAPLSVSPMPLAYLQPDRTTAFYRLSRSGATFALLTDDLGAGLLTWFREAFRARTSALQARAQASTESAAGCGPTWRGSLARFDPDSHFWRTSQPSLLGDSGECSVTWPRSGMTAGGQCWELPMLGRRIRETGAGLWRTPSAMVTEPKSTVVKLTGRKPTDPQVGLADQVGGSLNPTWVEWLMGWPIGWTDLKLSATAKFRAVPLPHGRF